MPITNVYLSGPESKERGTLSLAQVLHSITKKPLYQSHESSYYISGSMSSTGGFTPPLKQQLDELIKNIQQRAKRESFTLNLYGYKAAGVMAFWLCKQLKDIENIKINASIFDPVPGNFIRTSYLDKVLGINSTFAAETADLSDCVNIKELVILFINEPLSDSSCQAPLLPILPKQAKFVLDVLPGPHQDADTYCEMGGKLEAKSNCSTIAFHYIFNFLNKWGTTFDYNFYMWQEKINPQSSDKKQLIELLENENKKIENFTRFTHFNNRVQSKKGQRYLNLLHRELDLLNKEKTSKDKDCALFVEFPVPEATYWNGQKTHPYGPMATTGAAMLSLTYGLYNYPVISAPLAACYLYNKYKSKPSPQSSALQEVNVDENKKTTSHLGYNKY